MRAAPKAVPPGMMWLTARVDRSICMIRRRSKIPGGRTV
jgi:hypothetical protein